MQIQRHRPILYFENDLGEASSELLSYAMEKLGYDLFWHPAQIFDEENFFGIRSIIGLPETSYR